MIEFNAVTFGISMFVMCLTTGMGVWAGVQWGAYRERCDWNDLIERGIIPHPGNKPPDAW